MIEEVRRTIFTATCYFAGLAALVVLLTVFGLSIIKNVPSLLPMNERPKSMMEEQLETAREIKAALSRPIRVPEPLPPITAKLANPPPSANQGDIKAHSKSRMSQRAREAFDMDASVPPLRPATDYYPPIDRFKPL